MRWIDRALGAAFLCALAIPGLMALDHGQANVERTAKIIRRRTARAPTWPRTLGAAAKLPKVIDKWFNHAWGGREAALRANARLAMELFEVSPAMELYFGEQGWVFSGRSLSRESFTGTDPLSAEELIAWQRSFEDRRAWLAERGIDHVVVLVPHKSSIYPEMLPAGVRNARGTSRREQFQAWMADHSDVTLVDVAPAMLAVKPDPAAGDTSLRDLYSPHGVHWTSIGGHAAYGAIAAYLAEHHNAPASHPLGDYVEGTRGGGGDSWAGRMLLDGVIEMKNLTLTPRVETGVTKQKAPNGTARDLQYQHPDKTRPRIVMAHDSCGGAVRELLSEHAEVLETRWRRWLERDVVERVQPDVVIELYTELILETSHPFRLPDYLGPDVDQQFAKGTAVYSLDVSQPLEFEAAAGQPDVEFKDGAPVLSIERQVVALRLPPPTDPIPPGSDLILELDLSATGNDFIGIYRGTEMTGAPTSGEMIPLRVHRHMGRARIPLLQNRGDASTWLFLPASLQQVTVRGAEIRACARPK